MKNMRLAVRLTRGIAIAVAWLLSVALAASVGWSLGLYESRRSPAADRGGSASVPTGPDAGSPVRPGTGPDPRRSASAAEPGIEQRDEEPLRAEASPLPKPSPTPAAKAAPKKKPAPTPTPTPMPEEPPPPEPEPVIAEDRGPSTLERAREADRLADAHQAERAKAEATALLGEVDSYTGLTAALVADGADEETAQLIGVRVLQLAGQDTTSREVARELRRSYSASREISESIRRWGLLSPRILSATPSIEGSQLVVTGKLENPDIGRIRRLRVEVEALDAGGHLLGKVEARVRPNVLEAGKSGEFIATFKKLDPASVMRTRASVVEWDSELVGQPDDSGTRATETAD